MPEAGHRLVARRARACRGTLGCMTGARRSEMLRAIGDAIRAREDEILRANEQDMRDGRNLSSALRDRLLLDPRRVRAMADAVDAIAGQPDPVGEIESGRVLPNGVRLERRRVPLGVVLVIYESRPNVTSDAAALCLKAGNAVVLKGGREAHRSNRAIVECIRSVLEDAGAGDAVGYVDASDRSVVADLLSMRGVIDLAIPRGGPRLMEAVAEHARIPVIKHDAGNCHLYIDSHVDGVEHMIRPIVLNAKVQRPGVCNAIETLLVHRDVAPRVLPLVLADLSGAGVEIRGDGQVREIFPDATPARDEDWDTEYLDLVLAVRVVAGFDQALEHIRAHGSGHTECIITSSIGASERFAAEVDAANIAINCSTRFADGGEYGLGAEIGISTEKLHARGPMGARDLTTWQWVMTGSGQVRS